MGARPAKSLGSTRHEENDARATTALESASQEVTPAVKNDKRLLYWAAGLSAGALIAHVIDAPDHLAEWWGYATFFVIAGAFQFFYAFVLLLQPWRYDDTGGVRDNADRFGQSYFMLGTVISASIVAVYIVSRTTGLPFFGPEAAAEPVTLLSLVPTAEDMALLYCLVRLLIRTRVHSEGHLDAA